SLAETTSRRPAEVENNLIVTEPGRPPLEPRDAERDPMRIDLEPFDPPVIFFPPDAYGFRFRGRGQITVEPSQQATRGPEGELRYPSSDDRGLKYDVVLPPSHEPALQRLLPSERSRYLALPPGLSDRVGALAREWTAGASSPREQANAIEAHLKRDYRYDVSS